MEKYSEWQNTTSGHLGVVKHDDDGKPRGVSVRPGGTCLLTEKDRVATANAPRNPANNPFTNGSLVCVAAEAELSHRRPIGDASSPVGEPEPEPAPEPAPEGETGAAPPPEGDPPQGQAAPHEEAATPPSPAAQVEQVEPAQPPPEPVKVTQEGDAEEKQAQPPVPTPTPTPTPTPQQ